MTASQSWVKHHTRDLDDPALLRLSWEERAIWWALQLVSRAHSDVGGMFVRREAPMTLEDIALILRTTSASDRKLLERTMAALVAHELMSFTQRDGYAVRDWDAQQSGVAKEGREAWAARKRNQRERDRRKKAADDRAAAAAARQDNVRPIR